MSGVTISALIKKMNLELLTKEINTDKIKLYHPDVNRPALQLAGYYEHFDRERVQLIGVVAYTYMQAHLTEEQRLENYEKLLSSEIPCIIFSTNNRPGETFLKIASKYKVPVMLSDKKTSPLMAEIIRWLNVELAPTISIHGVLVDVYGEGVLITGESGIGKSEAALELIKRGHRLVSDDVVEIRKVSDETLVGSAPDITRHFIELRGIGIIDVKTLFGVEAVKKVRRQSIWLLIWRIGIRIRNMTVLVWRIDLHPVSFSWKQDRLPQHSDSSGQKPCDYCRVSGCQLPSEEDGL